VLYIALNIALHLTSNALLSLKASIARPEAPKICVAIKLVISSKGTEEDSANLFDHLD